MAFKDIVDWSAPAQRRRVATSVINLHDDLDRQACDQALQAKSQDLCANKRKSKRPHKRPACHPSVLIFGFGTKE